MRILEVSFRNPYKEGSGGLESYIYGLSNYLTSVGVDVKVIYCGTSQNINEKYSKNTVCVNIPKIIAYFKLDKMYYNLKLFFYLTKNKKLYDIVHINGDNGTYIPYVKGIKTIMTLHGSMAEFSNLTTKTHGYKKFISLLSDRYLGFTEKIACKKSNSVIAVSSHIKNYFEKLTGRNDIILINTCICPDPNNEINPNLKSKLLQYKKDNNLLCLWVGKDPKRKGLDIAKNLVVKLENVFLFTVGYIDPVKTHNVQNLGIVSDKDLITLYRYCDIFIFPTVYEGFSIALLEAMSYGLVPLTFSIPSTMELILNKNNGYLCANEDEMLKILNDLNRHRESLINLRKNAIECSRNYYCDKLYPEVYNVMKQQILD